MDSIKGKRIRVADMLRSQVWGRCGGGVETGAPCAPHLAVHTLPTLPKSPAHNAGPPEVSAPATPRPAHSAPILCALHTPPGCSHPPHTPSLHRRAA